jgi:hypothetical protein
MFGFSAFRILKIAHAWKVTQVNATDLVELLHLEPAEDDLVSFPALLVGIEMPHFGRFLAKPV